MAAAASTVMTPDPPGYFVGRRLHYQDQQPQTVLQPEPPTQPPAPGVDDQNAVNAQVPGYYRGRVPQTPNHGTEHNNNNNNNAGASVQQNREQPSFFAKLFVCFSGTS